MTVRALVWAGQSFVGGRLARRLRDAGHEVLVTTRRGADGPGQRRCDVTDAARVGRVVADFRPDWVFQCAAVTDPSAPPSLCYEVHVDGTLNVLNAVARHAPAATVVLFGSAAEYGAVPEDVLPVSETHAAQPRSFYGASKLAQTDLAAAAAAELDLSVLVVRPFNVLGPGLPPQYLAGALARRLRTEPSGGRAFEVDNGAATRDFVDVRDVAEAVLALAERAAPPRGERQVYNIASGVEVPVLAIARKLCTLAGRRPPLDRGVAHSRSGLRRSCGDASRLRARVGWAPHIGWERSLEDMWGGLPLAA
jgi:GDP-4-dehydro-6-deoxy-D-mannose reductase